MRRMQKKAQLDFPIITWIIIVFMLILLAPVLLRVFNTIKPAMSSSLGNITGGGDIAAANFNSVMDTTISFWDKIVVAAFILATLIMFVSAFLIDSSPIWVILYIIVAFMLVLFAPNIIGALDNVYGGSFAVEANSLSFMSTLIDHFGEFLVGMIAITGIIIYGKIAFFGSSRGVRQ